MDVRIIKKGSYSGYRSLCQLAVLMWSLLEPVHFCNNKFMLPVSVYGIYRVFNLKVDRILIWVIYLLRFTTCYITELTCIYNKCWKWCPFILMHLSTRFTMFLTTFLSVLSFTSSMAWVIFIFKILNFSKKFCLQWA